jgi:hypothetical protein
MPDYAADLKMILAVKPGAYRITAANEGDDIDETRGKR